MHASRSLGTIQWANATLVFRRDQLRSQLPPDVQLWKARTATKRGQRTLTIHRALNTNKSIAYLPAVP
jgi:hypothetical protein